MKSSKKSVVGHVVLQMLLGGESSQGNKGLSVRTVAFCLIVMLLSCEIRIVLFGLKSGY
jgi:hypothetical protein